MPEVPLPEEFAKPSLIEDMPISYGFRPPYWAKLQALLAQVSDVCIGIVGLPGAGKTTLLRVACDGGLSSDRDRQVRFMVSAPVSGDPLEIARQLVLGLCVALIREGTGANLRRASTGVGRRALIVSVLAIISGAALLALSAKGVHLAIQAVAGAALVLAGIVGLPYRLAVSAVHLVRPSVSGDLVFRPRELYERAAALAEALDAERRFETTVTRGWTTGVTPVPGLALGATGSVAKKILPMSLSELAEHYNKLVLDIGYDTPLLACIDGLDKCSPATDIEQILFAR
jgi:hypothetical protein